MPLERSNASPFSVPLSTEYAALPKRFGLTYPNALLSVGERAEKVLQETPHEPHNSLQRALHHEIAADSYLEASLTAADPEHEHDDERLLLVDASLSHYHQSATIREERTMAGYEDPDDITSIVRLEIRIGLENAYKDIICGEVTPQTCREALELLEEKKLLVTKVSRGIEKGIEKGHYPPSDHTYLSTYTGLLAEIHYLQSVWKDAEQNPTSVAFLSTIRGGSGNIGIPHKISRDTHDVVVATIGDRLWTFKPVEVKRASPNRMSATQHLGRYASEIAYVSRHGLIQSVPEKHPSRKLVS